MTVKISDVLTPEVWKQYGVQKTTDLSVLRSSGVMKRVDDVTLPKGGGTINVPHWNPLTGSSQTLSDNSPLSVKKTTAGSQMAVVIGRGDAWSVNDLAGVFAGSDPAMAIVNGLAAYWAAQDQQEVLAILAGVFSSATMTGNLLDISALTGDAAKIDKFSFLDATQKLGDAKGSLSAFVMHSMTENALAKQQLIEYVQPAGQTDRVPFYMGKRVLVDDATPYANGVFTSYLFGAGSIGYDEGAIGVDDIESDRDILAGDTVITMRKRMIVHALGTKWKGASLAGAFPTREELAMAANWERVFANKQIPIVAFKHKV